MHVRNSYIYNYIYYSTIIITLYISDRISSHGIIKVADFGLTEDIYLTGYYRQTKSNNPSDIPVKLPLKWMAMESFHDGLFNEKTDVVSGLF